MTKSPEYERAFDDGVCFVLEELALYDMPNTKDSTETLWKGSLSSDRERYIATMKRNNPEIYQDRVKPIIKNIKNYSKNI